LATLFISDLHLSGERPEIISTFLRFLDEQASEADALYILGDLFELWIGDDAIPDTMDPVIKKLAELTSAGLPVFIMRGNRDFLLNKQFEKLTGCSLLDDSAVIDLYGTPTLLLHGDTLCIDDVDYQAFRSMVRDPDWQASFLSKSVEERLTIGHQAREESKARTKEKPEDIMDVNKNEVKNTFRAHQVLQMIHGHTHRPAIHNLSIDDQPAKRIVLGDWYHQASVLVVEGDDYQLTPGG